MFTSIEAIHRMNRISTQMHGNTQTTKQDREIIQSMLGREIASVDIFDPHDATTGQSIQNVSVLRLTFKDDEATFFAAKSVDLPEGIEIFVVEIFPSLVLRRYPGGPLVDWHPLVALETSLKGSTVCDIRLLTARWRVVADNAEKTKYYGSNPRWLDYDFTGEASTYEVEDGLMLLCSNNRVLVVSAVSDLSQTLKVWWAEI